MAIDTIKFFNGEKAYGFIQPDDGSADSFVHIPAVQAAGMQTLDKDPCLNYEVETDRKRKGKRNQAQRRRLIQPRSRSVVTDTAAVRGIEES